MRTVERQTMGCAKLLLILGTSVALLLPVIACLFLPILDIPGQVSERIHPRSLGGITQVIPNDAFTTGSVQMILAGLNCAALVSFCLAVFAYSQVKLGRKGCPRRFWVILAVVLALHTATGWLAANTYSVAGPEGFAVKSFASRLRTHPWSSVAQIRRFHVVGTYVGRSGGLVRDPLWYQYQVLFKDGTAWESTTDRNWAWPITERAMKVASGYAHVPISYDEGSSF